MRTGARTFESAAFLRRKGADTVKVKKMFNSTIEEYRGRSELVSSAQLYGRCAIAATEEVDEALHVLAPQAADELLTIIGVDASFVMYPEGTGVSVSARSLGGMNVQLIMEKLGGGGHFTVSGAQLKDCTTEEAKDQIRKAIEEYLEEETV
jgi:c-di-AMP phosphodiesterase-like protein